MQYSGTYSKPRLDLGAAVMEFIDNAGDWIGVKAAPIFKTAVKAGSYSAITRESLTQEADLKRGARGNYNRVNFAGKDKAFACKEYGLEGVLGDDERALYAKDFDAEVVNVKGTTRIVMLGQEKRIAELLLNTSTFTGTPLYTDKSGTPWTTASTDVQKQVREIKTKVRQNCGMEPNTFIMGAGVKDYLIDNEKVRDAIKYTARLSEAEVMNALADYFGVQKLLIGGVVRNSAKEGQAFSGADVWGTQYVMACVTANDGNDLSQPAVARTFLWAEDSEQNPVVEQYREEGVRGDVFRVRHSVHEVVVDANFGHLLKIR